MSDLIAVSCQRCQSALDIPADATLATCGRCGARLTVRRSDTAAWTEIAGDGAAEFGPSANDAREGFVSRADYEALKRRIDLEALEREALAQAGQAIAGRTGQMLAPLVPAAPGGRDDATPQWIDTAAMRRRLHMIGLPPLVLVAGCTLNAVASLMFAGNWIVAFLCLGGSALFLSPLIIGLVLSHRRLNAYEAERRAFVHRRSELLATDEPAASPTVTGGNPDL